MWSTSQTPLDTLLRAATVGAMLPLLPGISATPLKDATPLAIAYAVDAVADSLRPGSTLHASMVSRWNLAQDGHFPNCLWLLSDDHGAAGWVGWAPYQERPDTWQSTTYFAARLRGTGLLSYSRCIQIHARDTVRDWHSSVGLPPPAFLSSIATWNERSLRASTRYALANEWPNTWETVYEPIAGRHAWVLTWPNLAAHTCFAPTFEPPDTATRVESIPA